MTLDHWRDLMVVIAAIGQTLFTVLYMLFPWYKTFLGRALFIKAMMFTALLDTAVVGVIYDWPSEDAWIVVLYGLTAFGIWAQFVAFFVQWTGGTDQTSTQEKRDYHHGTSNRSGEIYEQIQGARSRTGASD